MQVWYSKHGTLWSGARWMRLQNSPTRPGRLSAMSPSSTNILTNRLSGALENSRRKRVLFVWCWMPTETCCEKCVATTLALSSWTNQRPRCSLPRLTSAISLQQQAWYNAYRNSRQLSSFVELRLPQLLCGDSSVLGRRDQPKHAEKSHVTGNNRHVNNNSTNQPS